MNSTLVPTVRREALPSILIVDEDADSRLLYRTVLARVAEKIFEAEDGAEALGKAMCCRPAVVVTETRLRRIDGYALCCLLRQERLTNTAAIVVVTGAAFPADVEHARDAGADEVLVKPCLPDEVVAAAYRSWRRRNASEFETSCE